MSLVPVYEIAYADAAKLLRQEAPDHALVVSCAITGAVYHYTGMSTLVFDSVAPEDFARYVERARRASRPIYAVLFDVEEEEALRRHCPGEWKRVNGVRNIGIWQLQ
jgi:hypothetical protein